jgi:hypothetical protein
MPWSTRQAISQLVDCDRAARIEPVTKMARPVCTSSLRSNRSASLPQIGVLTVRARRVEVTTQV